MTGRPGRRLGSGRHADIFEYGDDCVLRRYRDGRSAVREAEIMRWVHDRGYPVPEVDDVDGPDLVMERIDGRTMLTDLIARPWMLATHAKHLAALHEDLHLLRAPGFVTLSPFAAGESLLHLDLQPANVLLSARGPVVIDWTFSARGPAAADVTHTLVQMRTWQPPSISQRAATVIGRRWFAKHFLKATDTTVKDIDEWIPAVCSYRLTQRELTTTERTRLRHTTDRR